MVKSKSKGKSGKAANKQRRPKSTNAQPKQAFHTGTASTNPDRSLPNDKKAGFYRSKATIRRLNMYTSKPDLAKRREQPTKPVRIQPDRRWFGNTRVTTQSKLEQFREAMTTSLKDPYSVLLKRPKIGLPSEWLTNDGGANDGDGAVDVGKVKLLTVEPFEQTFGRRQLRKRPKLVSGDLEGLVAHAESKVSDYSEERDGAISREDDGVRQATSEKVFDKGTSRRIWQELYKVVDSSDVIIQVLDARDPQGTRCRSLEDHLRKERSHKHLVLLLNKCDLIPTWATAKWVKVLAREYPTLAFHASITNPFGKHALINLLRQFAGLHPDRRHLSVGFIGYPNVGKSSVINTLKRKKVCKAAPVPGETKIWQYVSLTNRIYLIDCPGVVPGDSYRTDGTQDTLTVEADKVLKGIVRAEKLSAPAEYVNEVLSRVKKEYLLKKYNLPADTTWTDDEDFLTILAKKCGRLLKGGDPDIQTAARTVIYDFQRGRIPYFVPPPMLNDPSHKHQTATAASGATSDSTVAVVAAEPSAVTESSQEGDEGDKETPPVKVKQSFKALKCSMDFDSSDLGTRGGAPDEQQEDDADGALDADDQDQDDGSDADDARAESKRQRLLAALKRKRQLSSPPPRKRAKEGGATMDKGKGGRVDQPGSSGAPSVPIAGPLSRVKAPKGEDVDWGMLYKEFES
ncbi:unnamed protein product [Vitrella brassicaformis CCMP3155]|uniref:Nucleolar GTP-binding protein 2 n=3 Tax=Vitrella brassicaformis TaxID=1169539 RepID=A0A0G4H8F8_VITBC|nr:unnamed protein product [Vitrella brassicaformis CCMP3155]|eukprot:CEM40048.1 unnamed protein product [Vitrella brassicaformis CCMP3155]